MATSDRGGAGRSPSDDGAMRRRLRAANDDALSRPPRDPRPPATPAGLVPRSTAARGARAFAIGTLTVLALVAGFAFAGTGEEHAPESEAAVRAASVAAVRVALGQTELPAGEPPAPQQVQQLIPGESFVRRETSATRIRIASAGIDAEIRDVGYTFRNGELQYDVPRHEAGQYAGSSAPGEQGNLVIGGHVSQRSGVAVFQNLPLVDPGDIIEVFKGDEIFRYVVKEIRVVPADATEVMRQTQDTRLTLITCFAQDNYRDRLVVIGELL